MRRVRSPTSTPKQHPGLAAGYPANSAACPRPPLTTIARPYSAGGGQTMSIAERWSMAVVFQVVAGAFAVQAAWAVAQHGRPSPDGLRHR